MWLRNLYEPLLDLGHDVELVDATPAAQARSRGDSRLRTLFSEYLWLVFLEKHRRNSYDLVFTYLMDGMVDPSVIDAVRERGRPHVQLLVQQHSPIRPRRRAFAALRFQCPFGEGCRCQVSSDWSDAGLVPHGCEPHVLHGLWTSRAFMTSHLWDRGMRNDQPTSGTCLRTEWMSMSTGQAGGSAVKDEPASSVDSLAAPISQVAAVAAAEPAQQATASARLAWLDAAERLRRKYPTAMHGPVSHDEMIRKYSESCISLGFTEVFDAA